MLRFSRVRHFPATQQPIDGCAGNYAIPPLVSREKSVEGRFYIDNSNARLIRCHEIDNLSSYLTADVRRVPNEVLARPEQGPGFLPGGLYHSALAASLSGAGLFSDRVQ